jgi:hypothetical protein
MKTVVKMDNFWGIGSGVEKMGIFWGAVAGLINMFTVTTIFR